MEEGRVSRFKTVGEKHLFSEIEIMLWSPKVDLIAMTTIDGEVVLYRITWQKVWSLPRLDEGVNVSALAWRPDGKVLAVGYTNGCVKLYNIEGGFCLHDHKPLEEKVVMLKWVSELPKDAADKKSRGHAMVDSEDIDANVDEFFLPELPPITNKEVGETNKSTEDFKRLKDQKLFNLLLVGTHSGTCELFAFGIISISKLTPKQDDLTLVNMILSADFKAFVIALRDNDDRLLLNIYDSSNLQVNQELLQQTSLKLGKLETLLEYLDEVLLQMGEVWEDILVEIESKLMRFAENKNNGRSLSFEFLRLLLYGTPSDDLKHFLHYDLTKQAFSKLGRSVQASYRQIQILLLKNLHTVTHNIIFHLKNLLALSRCSDNYTRLGVVEGTVAACLRNAESVMLKGAEMVAVIETSVRNFNAFYKWLYPAKMKLSGETAILKMSQQEVCCVAQFLKENFDTTKSRLKLEKLGQYLRDEDLSMPPEGASEASFMAGMSATFKENTKHFYPQFVRHKSLVQLTKALRASFQDILLDCSNAMKPIFFKHVKELSVNLSSAESPSEEPRRLSCYDGPHNPLLNTHSFLTAASTFHFSLLYSSTSSKQRLSLFAASITSNSTFHVANVCFWSTQEEALQEILDASFFDDHTLSLLLTDDASAKLFLLDLTSLKNFFVPLGSEESVADVDKHPVYMIKDSFCNSKQCKDLQTFKPSCMCINGQRKVGTVASSSRKWIQLFLIDSDDEEEGEEEEEVDEEERMDVSSTADTLLIARSGALVCEDDKENSDVYD